MRGRPARGAGGAAGSGRRDAGRRFTVAQALAAGFTKPAIRHAAATGRWTRLRRGVLARLLFHTRGLPPFDIQVEIFLDGVLVARVDYLWRRQRLVVEVDGAGKYGDPRRIRHERQRDAALLEAGYRVLHVTWAQVVHRPDQTVATIARLLAPGSLIDQSREGAAEGGF